MAVNEYFEAMLDENPADWTTRLVYSDWLLEAGDPVMALSQRWMAQEKKHPVNEAFLYGCINNGPHQISNNPNISSTVKYKWYWQTKEFAEAYFKKMTEERIPRDLMRLVPGSMDLAAVFGSRREAEAGLALALQSAMTEEWGRDVLGDLYGMAVGNFFDPANARDWRNISVRLG